jgi:hypothetical protein
VQTTLPSETGPRAFGLSLNVDGPRPPGDWEMQALHAPEVQVRMVAPAAIENAWSGRIATGWEGVIDGARFIVERGVDGDHRFVHGTLPGESGAGRGRTLAVHHLSADASVLECAPLDPSEPSWWRVVLDSVLFSVALLHGYEALHAGAVVTSSGVIAITARTGGGKSTLLTELLGHGQALMADDVLMLESQGARAPLAHPAAPLMTIPRERISTFRARGGDPPEVISALDGEHWIAAPVCSGPLPLKALVVLDRRPGLQTNLEKIENPLAPLLGALMNFPRSFERQQTRFELASVLADKTALWRLTADLDVTPDILADTLLKVVSERG